MLNIKCLIATLYASGLAAIGAVILISGSFSPAIACDLECNMAQQQQHAQEMNRMAFEANSAAQAQANADSAAAAVAEASRPKTLQFAHGAVVWYLTSAGEPGIYITAGEANSSNAKASAMSNCYHLGGLNCRVADTWYRGFAAVAKADDGSLFYNIGQSKNEARSGAKKLCGAKEGCQILATYDNQGTLFYAD